jgi:two-component system, OmpR family, phosphate regulon sensor histidine kinase PhoR
MKVTETFILTAIFLLLCLSLYISLHYKIQLDIFIAVLLILNLCASLLKRKKGSPRPEAASAHAPTLSILDASLTVFEALGKPFLLLQDYIIIRASSPAVHLLGSHIIGSDVRLVLRDPKIPTLFTGDIDTVEIDHLISRNSRWLLRLSKLEDAYQCLELTDKTKDYATERMRTDFVANASHELRTPLASVLGFVETLLQDNPGSDKATRIRFLKIIEMSAERMLRLTNDLMSLSQIEANRALFPTQKVDLCAIVKQTVDEIQASVASRLVFTQPDMPLPPIYADTGQIQQVLHNLIDNSIKYSDASRPVSIRLCLSNSYMLLEIEDEGEGISPEHLPRLTERFYRVDATRSRSQNGTGLGLAIVKHIMERHRAKLEITSTIGKGTCVKLLFPI